MFNADFDDRGITDCDAGEEALALHKLRDALFRHAPVEGRFRCTNPRAELWCFMGQFNVRLREAPSLTSRLVGRIGSRTGLVEVLRHTGCEWILIKDPRDAPSGSSGWAITEAPAGERIPDRS
eukprot:gene2344-45538_t